MAHYEKATVELTNKQLKKLKSSAKSRTGTRTTLRITKKNCQGKELP